ncbi:MAG TPA: FAD-dependent monooxygenase [Cellvibrio sp.]|nr:FAD-dependent monooxygenase [Cellvibrio sp.]
MTHHDAILIVGAGPTGLTLANDLARRKVPFKIIDSKPGPSRDSKGLAINISSQYGLRLAGVNPAPGGNGMPVSRLNLYWQGRRFSSINFAHLPIAINSLITQPQAITETELLRALEATGNYVQWNCKLTHIKETNNAVEVRYATAGEQNINEHIVEERYSFLAGCDGKHSVVRAQLNTSFAGVDYPMHFVLGDFRFDPGMAANQVHYYVYEDTFFILVPIAEGTWRVVVKYDGAIPQEPVSVQHIAPIIARHFGANVELGEPLWISRAPFYNRVAGQLNSQRLFIAGDAAHLFSPIGGTGMNTGIQDALNLGWKLAAVYRGISHRSLLDTYAEERLPAIREAAHLSNLSTQLITRQIVDHPVLDKLAATLSNRSFLKQIAPALHSGIAQKIAVPAPYIDDIPAHSRMGQFPRELFYWLDHLQRNHQTPQTIVDSGSPVSFWCFIAARCIAPAGIDAKALQTLRKNLLAYPECRIIYIANEFTQHAGVALSSREHIVALDMPEADVRMQKDVVLVRPDGLVFYESGLDKTANLHTAISSNFHFTTNKATAKETLYEEAI